MQRHHAQRRIGAADGGRGIGHIDLMHHAEDQREADADQGVGSTKKQSIDNGLKNIDDDHDDRALREREAGASIRGDAGLVRAIDVISSSGYAALPICRALAWTNRNGFTASRSAVRLVDAHQALGFFQLGETIADLGAVGLHGIRLGEHALALHHVLEHRDDLVGGTRMQIEAAFELPRPDRRRPGRPASRGQSSSG